jgi:hypothetical protein
MTEDGMTEQQTRVYAKYAESTQEASAMLLQAVAEECRLLDTRNRLIMERDSSDNDRFAAASRYRASEAVVVERLEKLRMLHSEFLAGQ